MNLQEPLFDFPLSTPTGLEDLETSSHTGNDDDNNYLLDDGFDTSDWSDLLECTK